MQMKPALKKVWIEALPLFKKAKGKLRGGDGSYDVFGVLETMLGAIWEYDPTLDVYFCRFQGCKEFFFLRPSTRFQANISVHHEHRLIKLNDTSDTWEPIIKYIEENM